MNEFRKTRQSIVILLQRNKFFIASRLKIFENYYSREIFWFFYLDNDDILRIIIFPMG